MPARRLRGNAGGSADPRSGSYAAGCMTCPTITAPAPRSPVMPQMFDWIFFAIMLPVPAYLVWDYMRHR
jgi:hypothetical protein